MTFDWSPFVPAASGEFVKWDNPGDTVTGHVAAIRVHTFDEKKGPVPLIDLQRSDGEVVTLVIDKVDLRSQVTLLAPQVGDKLRVTFKENRRVPNSPNPMKIFDIQHKPNDRPAPDDVPPVEEYSEEPF